MFIGVGLLLSSTTPLWAGEMDVLLDKLVEKGILSPIEANIIKDETKERVTKEVSEAKSYAVPAWVQNTKIKGDVRLRYQYEMKDQDIAPRHRGRVRARVGIISKIAQNLNAGIGLASGSADPRSTNATLENTFDKPDIRLDYAFVEWLTRVKGLKMIGGKFVFTDYLWAPTDMLWDTDINPEGGSLHYEMALMNNLDFWVNGGVWIIDENGKVQEQDPFMKYVQTGLTFTEGIVDAKAAVTYYSPHSVKDKVLENTASTNTAPASHLQSLYRSLGFGTEIGLNKPFGGLPFNIDERIAVFGEYVKNLDDSVLTDELSGHSFGFVLGSAKVSDPKTWQFRYIKTKLEKDAFLDTFPDSDRFGGATDIEAHEGIFSYAPKKNVTLNLDYYKSWRLRVPGNKERLLQADVVFKF